MTLVITTCTNRKRKPVDNILHASTLPQAEMSVLATEWGHRLARASNVYPADAIYGGRNFQEAVLAADLLNARLMIVSAGLGLISVNEQVPPYACTVLANATDSIEARSLDRFTVSTWWKTLGSVSPYHQSLRQAACEGDGLICAALSESYIEMFADDLLALPEAMRARLRLFTRAPLANIAADLHGFVMPYDDRLDGCDSPIRGTRGDFAGRALRHFAAFVASEGDHRSTDEHAEAVRAAQSGWSAAPRYNRLRLDDAAILDLLRNHWEAERGSTSRLLRRLRDTLGVACEQGRFACLARQVRIERA